MSTLIPFRAFRRDPFFADFDTLVRRAFGPMTLRPTTEVEEFVPAAEVVREGDDAIVRLELPGLDVGKDVQVDVDGRELVVHGERRDERSEERGGRTLREVRYGSFSRSFTLPEHVTAEDVSAGYAAGVLSVRVKGTYAKAEKGTRSIPIGAEEATEAPAVTEAEADKS